MKNKTITVKGWAVIDGSHFCVAVPTKRQANAGAKLYKGKIVPCIITYQPIKNKKKSL